MEITINNEKLSINNPNLAQILQSRLGDKTAGIAVAVNQEVIPKAMWPDFVLKEKDEILIIKATQGG